MSSYLRPRSAATQWPFSIGHLDRRRDRTEAVNALLPARARPDERDTAAIKRRGVREIRERARAVRYSHGARGECQLRLWYTGNAALRC